MGNTADDFSGDRIRAVGYPIDAFWGYKSDGLYTVDDFDYDIATNTYTPKATTPIIEEYRTKVQPGDIKYVDIDGDGKITPTEDRCYIGSAIPRYNYTIGLNAAWRGIDFSLFYKVWVNVTDISEAWDDMRLPSLPTIRRRHISIVGLGKTKTLMHPIRVLRMMKHTIGTNFLLSGSKTLHTCG